MSKRKVVISLLGLVFLVICIIIAQILIGSKTPPQRNELSKAKKLVKIMVVKNEDLQPQTELLMNMNSRNKIELFTEVNGRLSTGGKEFREGTSYTAGEAILRLDDEEQRMNLLAQKAAFLNLLTGILPDLKLDYPDAYLDWEKYVMDFDETKSLPELPESRSSKEKFFLSSRNVLNQFYSIKSAEARLDKYTVRAPFSGKVISALVSPGALVRAGQKMGDYVGQGNFEAEGGIGSDQLDFVELGDSISFTSPERTGSWSGVVTRISDAIDPATQTVKIYASVNGEGLKDGMYLNATVHSKELKDCFRIDRNLLIEGNKVFAVEDSTLSLQDVEVIRKGVKSALIRGIANGTQILSEPVNNAYDGMLITPQK